jgi:PAS domain S-box-containing protein
LVQLRILQRYKIATAQQWNGRISLLVLCFGLLGRELTERKRAQEALAKSEKWFSTTLGSIGDAVIAADMNGAVSFMNSVAQSLTGWSLEEARGKSMDLVFDIVNKETRRPAENPVKKVFREGKVIGLADHTLLISKSGQEFEIGDSAAPILTDGEEGFGVVLVFRDVTGLNQARAELEKYFTLSIELLCIAGADGYFKRLNPAWEKVVGFSTEELLAKPFLEFVHPDDRQATIQENERLGAGNDTISFENRYLCKDGSYKWLMWSATPSDEHQTVYAVARDITDLKHTQAALVAVKEEAERSNKFKDQFLSTMSHELRTPLNAVLGFSDLLVEERYGPLNDRQRRYVTHIHTGGKHLLQLINDILDLSKIEAGRLQLALESVAMDRSFAEVIARPELRDPIFKESVVLMFPSSVEVGEGLVVGLILNKPARVELREIFPNDKELKNRSETAHFGGPVDPRAPGVVFRSSETAKQAALLFGDVYVSFDPDFIKELLKEPEKTPDLRLFVGRSQWATAQLQNEMVMGAWYSVRAETNLIFSASPQYLWRKLFEPGGACPCREGIRNALRSFRKSHGAPIS